MEPKRCCKDEDEERKWWWKFESMDQVGWRNEDTGKCQGDAGKYSVTDVNKLINRPIFVFVKSFCSKIASLVIFQTISYKVERF